MAGFRILAIILGLACLGMAAGMFFYRQPCVIRAAEWLWQDEALKSFVTSRDSRDVVVKEYMRYLVHMSAVIACGSGLMFLVAAVKPVRMRPFIVVVIIALILGIAMDIWSGVTLKKVSWHWWGIDAAGGAVLLILLLVLFPRKRKEAAGKAPETELEEQ